jgi:hypothetical protein
MTISKKPRSATVKRLFAVSGNRCAFPAVHHKRIDTNEDDYPAETLRQWKREHEGCFATSPIPASKEVVDELIRKLTLTLQVSGTGNTVIMGSVNIIRPGHDDIRQIAQAIYRANALHHQGEAAETADKRVQHFTSEFLDQFDALSLILSVRYALDRTVTDIDSFRRYFNRLVAPFLRGASKTYTRYQHLQYCGCISRIGIAFTVINTLAASRPGVPPRPARDATESARDHLGTWATTWASQLGHGTLFPAAARASARSCCEAARLR